jgi:hypothetical protein
LRGVALALLVQGIRISFSSAPRKPNGSGVFEVGEPSFLPQSLMRAAARSPRKRSYGKYCASSARFGKVETKQA